MDKNGQKTERMRIEEDAKPGQKTFSGSLKSGESIKGYTVEKLISAQTGEAEIFLAKKNSENAIIKYYHPNITPKEDVLIKFHNNKHPDIITLFEYGTYKGRFYEIMQ